MRTCRSLCLRCWARIWHYIPISVDTVMQSVRHVLILGLVGAACFGQILMFQFRYFAVRLLVCAQVVVNNRPFRLVKAVLCEEVLGVCTSWTFVMHTLYDCAHSSKGSATRVSSSVAIDLWACPWAVDSAWRPRNAISSEAPSSIPKPFPARPQTRGSMLMTGTLTGWTGQHGIGQGICQLALCDGARL